MATSNLFVVNYGNDSVTKYAAGSKGNVSHRWGVYADRQLGIALDGNWRISVSNLDTNSFIAFAPGPWATSPRSSISAAPTLG